jgi:pantetheine-phosphate adenylyltransferase
VVTRRSVGDDVVVPWEANGFPYKLRELRQLPVGRRSAEPSISFRNRLDRVSPYRTAARLRLFNCSFLCEFPHMRRAIYPGSFDPITNGHLDVIERARKLFDKVIVAVAHNDEKEALFSLEERLRFLQDSIGKIDKVRIAQFDGLLVEFAVAQKASAVIRGLRAVSDFEFEFQMALMNRKLETGVETIFLMPKEEYTYLSSRIIKEIARLGGDVSSFVPPAVSKALVRKFAG